MYDPVREGCVVSTVRPSELVAVGRDDLFLVDGISVLMCSTSRRVQMGCVGWKGIREKQGPCERFVLSIEGGVAWELTSSSPRMLLLQWGRAVGDVKWLGQRSTMSRKAVLSPNRRC